MQLIQTPPQIQLIVIGFVFLLAGEVIKIGQLANVLVRGGLLCLALAVLGLVPLLVPGF